MSDAVKRIEWLDTLRGIAAIWVLLHHANQACVFFIGRPSHNILLQNGHLGVDFFFALSGFIIFHSSRRIADSGGSISDYAWARAIRIYTPYLPIGIGIFFAYLYFPKLSLGGRAPGMLTTFLLIPSNQPPALSVAWTLVHEVFFYFIFSTYFISKKLLATLISIWTFSIIFINLYGIITPIFATYIFSPRNLSFIAGLAVYSLSEKFNTNKTIAISCLTVGIILIIWQALHLDPNHLIVTLGFVLVIFSASSASASEFRPNNFLLYFGSASYAIYLVHNPAISIAVRLVKRAIPGIAPLVSLAIVSSLALGTGIIYRIFVEVPVLKWIKSIRKCSKTTLSDPKHVKNH